MVALLGKLPMIGSTMPMIVAAWSSALQTCLPSGFSCGNRWPPSARLTMIAGTKLEKSPW
jgi:hypothetical protein